MSVISDLRKFISKARKAGEHTLSVELDALWFLCEFGESQEWLANQREAKLNIAVEALKKIYTIYGIGTGAGSIARKAYEGGRSAK